MTHPDPRPPIAEIGFEVEVPVTTAASASHPRKTKGLLSIPSGANQGQAAHGDDHISMMNFHPSPAEYHRPRPQIQNHHIAQAPTSPGQPYDYDLRHPDSNNNYLSSHSHHSLGASSNGGGTGHHGSHPSTAMESYTPPVSNHQQHHYSHHSHHGTSHHENINSYNNTISKTMMPASSSPHRNVNNTNSSRRRGSLGGSLGDSSNTSDSNSGDNTGNNNNARPDYGRKAYKLVTRTSQKMDMNSKFINFENEAMVPPFSRNELHLGPKLTSGTFNDIYTLNQIQLSSEESLNNKNNKTILHKRKQVALQSQNNLGSKGATQFIVKIVKQDLVHQVGGGDKYCKGAQNMVREQKFLASLQHPHIVQLYGKASVGFEGFQNAASSNDPYFFLVEKMETPFKHKVQEWRTQVDEAASLPSQKGFAKMLLLEKQKHKEQVSAKKRELFLKRLQVAADIASAMTYLHSFGIVYRDLNPKTIAFDSDGNVKLMDFAIAKELGKNQHVEGSRQTMIGPSSAGAPQSYYYYLAPEVILGQSYDTSVDVYSFGILLWHICSLKVPFRGQIGTPHEFLTMVSKGKERPPLNESWSAVLKNVMRWSWVDDRTVRPPMHEIHKAVQREIKIRPTSGFGTLSVSTDEHRNGVSGGGKFAGHRRSMSAENMRALSKSSKSLELQENDKRLQSKPPVQMTSHSAREEPRRSRSVENIRHMTPGGGGGGSTMMQNHHPTNTAPRKVRSVEDVRSYSQHQPQLQPQQRGPFRQGAQQPVRKSRSAENIRKLPLAQDWSLHEMQSTDNRRRHSQQQQQKQSQRSNSEVKQFRRSSMEHQQKARRRSISGSVVPTDAMRVQERRTSGNNSLANYNNGGFGGQRGGGSGGGSAHPRMTRRPSLEMMQRPQLVTNAPHVRMQRRRSLGF